MKHQWINTILAITAIIVACLRGCPIGDIDVNVDVYRPVDIHILNQGEEL
jgi:hypothetical protein